VDSPIVYLLDCRGVDRPAMAAAARHLSDADRRRRSEFAREERRTQFTLGRALLRCAAARAIDADPHTIVVTHRSGGRPTLTGPTLELPQFSLSHSGEWIACAIHPRVSIGVDVEMLDEGRDLEGIMVLSFGDDVQEWWRLQPDRTGAFYRLWTGREALIKLGADTDTSEARAGRLIVRGSEIHAPPPVAGWHHEEVRPGIALSLVWTAAVDAPRIMEVGPDFLAPLLAPRDATTSRGGSAT